MEIVTNVPAVVLLIGSFLVMIALRMPIVFAIGLSSIATTFYLDLPLQMVAQNMVKGLNVFVLLAVPFFILAGELMNSGGISRRIIDMAQAWVGHIRGGLGYVAIGAAVLMASMSGSALADTAALATILLPMMRQQGYPMNTSAGLIASGGIIAPIIPPSIGFVIFGVAANVSIGKLFVAGELSNLWHQPLEKLRAELLNLWGLGPETVDSILLYAGNQPIFVVDAYTRRIFSRLGLLPEKVTYAEMQRFFMDHLPVEVELYNEYHALIDALGNQVCLNRAPKCHLCPLAEQCQGKTLV